MFRAIPRHNINLTSAEINWVFKQLSGNLEAGLGRQQFETNAREFFGVSHALAVQSGRAALHLALAALNLQDGATILLPRYCFFSLIKVVEGMGYTPRFAPIDPHTFALDPAQLASHIDGVDAVVVIHPFGQIADMASLQAVCNAHGVLLVEDASQATGARLRGRCAGAIGDVGVFSLVSGKNLQTFGGGLVITKNPEIGRRLTALLANGEPSSNTTVNTAFRDGLQRWFLTTPLGFRTLMNPLTQALSIFSPTTLDRLTHEHRTPYDATVTPKLLSDAQGGLGSLELEQLDRRNDIRQANALRLLDGLKGLHGVVLPRFDPHAENSFNAVAIRVPQAKPLAKRLRWAGFDTRDDYMEWFGEHKDFEDEVIYLPNHPAMSNQDIDRLVTAVRRIVNTQA